MRTQTKATARKGATIATPARRTRTARAQGKDATTTTAAKKQRKAAKANKPAAPDKPTPAMLRIVKELPAANRGQDTIAILHDASTHVITDYAKHGVAVKVGDNFDERKAAYLKAVRARAEAPKGPGHLAQGLDGRNAPHSVKAHQDHKRGVGKPAKADKTAKKQARKVAREAKAAPKADDARRITIVDKKFTFGGDGTARRASWDACKSSKTVAEYLKAGGKAKYLPRWVASGAIKLA